MTMLVNIVTARMIVGDKLAKSVLDLPGIPEEFKRCERQGFLRLSRGDTPNPRRWTMEMLYKQYKPYRDVAIEDQDSANLANLGWLLLQLLDEKTTTLLIESEALSLVESVLDEYKIKREVYEHHEIVSII